MKWKSYIALNAAFSGAEKTFQVIKLSWLLFLCEMCCCWCGSHDNQRLKPCAHVCLFFRKCVRILRIEKSVNSIIMKVKKSYKNDLTYGKCVG